MAGSTNSVASAWVDIQPLCMVPIGLVVLVTRVKSPSFKVGQLTPRVCDKGFGCGLSARLLDGRGSGHGAGICGAFAKDAGQS